MTRTELTQATDACVETTREGLQTLWDNINKGQRKQLYKNAEIKALLDRYGVEVSD